MELAALEVERSARVALALLAGAEGAEILGGLQKSGCSNGAREGGLAYLRDDVRMELEDDFARRLLPDADVEEYQRVAPASARHFGWYERRGRGQMRSLRAKLFVPELCRTSDWRRSSDLLYIYAADRARRGAGKSGVFLLPLLLVE